MTTIMQRSFSGGELSPSLYARCDLSRFAISLRTMLNVVVPKGGGAENRAGLEYLYTLSGTYFKMIKWESNTDAETFVIIIGTTRINFFQGGSVVTTSGISAWSNVTAYVKGDLVSKGGINYYAIQDSTNKDPATETAYWFAQVGSEYSIPSPFTTQAMIEDFRHIQDGEKIHFVYKELIPFILTKSSSTNWVMNNWTTKLAGANYFFGIPDQPAPTSLTVTNSGGSGYGYTVTSINADTGEESLNSNVVYSTVAPSAGTPAVLNWTAAANSAGYNVYAYVYGTPYLLYFTTEVTFSDTGFTRNPDAEGVPTVRNPDLIGDPGTPAPGDIQNFPKVIGTYQQRTVIANTGANPKAIFLSKTGYPTNFTKKNPILDDGSISLQVRGNGQNSVRHVLDLGPLFVLTESGEWIIKGGSSGALTPSSVQPEQYSYNGSSELPPIIIGNSALYVQKQGSIVRSIGFDINSGGRDGYSDADLTAFADHIFKGYEIVSWCYQKTPDSILWAVRDDGALIGLTFIKEQNILAWHRHNTDGIVEEVLSIPEGSGHIVYARIKRTINGSTVRYLERMYSRELSDIVDAVFLDSALSYDGRNTGATTMTLSGGTTWDYDETLTLTASVATFTAGDVGNEIWITGTDDVVYRCAITAYTSTTVVSVKPDKLVPSTSGIRTTATTNWARAVDEVSGLSHLEAKQVGVFADGYVVANPNNAQYGTPLTVASGAITLPECHAVIHVGLPYISDIETLDIDTANGETIADKKRLVNKVTMHTHNTRGVWVGGKPPTDDDTDPLENLAELKLREDEDWATPTRLVTDVNEIIIDNSWNSNGRVFIRQIDPLPMTILSIAPTGLFPFRGGA